MAILALCKPVRRNSAEKCKKPLEEPICGEICMELKDRAEIIGRSYALALEYFDIARWPSIMNFFGKNDPQGIPVFCHHASAYIEQGYDVIRPNREEEYFSNVSSLEARAATLLKNAKTGFEIGDLDWIISLARKARSARTS